jgi:hypothetical protein
MEDEEEILDTLKINVKKGNLMSLSRRPLGIFCSNCLKDEALCAVKMRHVLKWREGNLEDKVLRQFVERVWGPEGIKLIEKLVKDPNWLEMQTKMCDSCYMEVTKK